MVSYIKFPKGFLKVFCQKIVSIIFLCSFIQGLQITCFPFRTLNSQAQTTKLKAGTLLCKSNGGVGLIVGSKESLNCTYSPLDGGKTTKYRGTITRIGLDLGIKGQSEIIWSVLGSTTSLRSDTLSGNYAGIAADVALGVGGGAQILLGGTDKSIILQPLSLKGQTGLNVAAGIAGLVLRRQ